MHRFVITFITAVFISIICYFIFIGFVIYKTADSLQKQDFSGGIKPVIEKAWCGQPGCFDNK